MPLEIQEDSGKSGLWRFACAPMMDWTALIGIVSEFPDEHSQIATRAEHDARDLRATSYRSCRLNSAMVVCAVSHSRCSVSKRLRKPSSRRRAIWLGFIVLPSYRSDAMVRTSIGQVR